MFGNTGDTLIRFSRSNVGKVLAHPSAKIHSSLTNVLRVVAAATCLEIDASLVELVRTRFVGAAQFSPRFGVEVDVIVEEDTFELTV